MFRVGQKVRIVRGEQKGKRGIVTYVGFDGGWISMRTNKGKDIPFVFENQVQSR